MLDKFSKRRSASAHVIVLGNEKGGSGKSTVASHVAVGLLKAGQRVATIDLDARQQSFTRNINNRRSWAAHTGLDLEVPAHFCIEQGRAMQIADNEELECQRLIDAVNGAGHNKCSGETSRMLTKRICIAVYSHGLGSSAEAKRPLNPQQ